ncbi:MAG: hypothetical protein IJ628_02455 [Bacteroidaceae bacterium]|nr:hypothetical protein [Bacteroidaceae bacterium]
MTEREVLQKQEDNGNQAFYLIQIGTFIHAYGHGAFALARATGYSVRRKHRKMGDILTCGFPADRVSQVLAKLEDAGATAELQPDGKTWLFSGIDGTPDESMVKEASTLAREDMSTYSAMRGNGASPHAMQDITDAIMGFNLSASTPLQAMMFIGELQKRIMKDEELIMKN